MNDKVLYKAVVSVIGSSLLTKAIIGVISLMIIRYMEYNEYAMYTFLISLTSMLIGVVVTSINKIAVCGRHEFSLNGKENSLMLVQIVIVSIFCVGLKCFYELSIASLIVLTLYTIAMTLSEFVKTVYQERLDFSTFNNIEIKRSLLYFVIVIIYLWYTNFSVKAQGVLLSNGIAFLLVSCAYGRCIFNKIKKTIINDVWCFIYQMFKSKYKYLVLYYIILSIMGQIAVLIIKQYGNDQQLAGFGVAFQFYNIFALVLSALTTVFLPGIQKAVTITEYNKFFRIQKKIIRQMIVVVLLGDILVACFIDLFFGGKYNLSIYPFLILSVLAIVSLTLSPYANLVIKFEKFKNMFYVCLIVLIFHIVTGVCWFMSFSLIGLSFSLLISHILLNTYNRYMGKKILDGLRET